MINPQKKDCGFREQFQLSDKDILPHKNLVKTAQDLSIKTEDLVAFATEVIRYERRHPESEHANSALLILQQRVTPEVLAQVRGLCQSTDPAERLLGVMILREFPGLSFEKPFVTEALEILTDLLLQETDLKVMIKAVGAVGWQQDPRAIAILLKYVEHPNDGVRFMVSNDLVLNCPEDNWFPPEIAAAYQKLCFDSDADVRWYAYANFADFLEAGRLLPPAQRKDLETLLKSGRQDKDPQVVEQAQNALGFLNQPPYT